MVSSFQIDCLCLSGTFNHPRLISLAVGEEGGMGGSPRDRSQLFVIGPLRNGAEGSFRTDPPPPQSVTSVIFRTGVVIVLICEGDYVKVYQGK